MYVRMEYDTFDCVCIIQKRCIEIESEIYFLCNYTLYKYDKYIYYDDSRYTINFVCIIG